jgi:ribosomal protein S18 acetylase RimI-like enzyme
MLEIKLLQRGDEQVFEHVREGVFDDSVDGRLAVEYLENPHSHIAVAIEDGFIIGFASGIDYIHPDKPAQLWVNEVGVAPTHQRRGIGKAVITALIDLASKLGCTEAWVLTEQENTAARGLYKHVGGAESHAIMVSFPLTTAK